MTSQCAVKVGSTLATIKERLKKMAPLGIAGIRKHGLKASIHHHISHIDKT